MRKKIIGISLILFIMCLLVSVTPINSIAYAGPTDNYDFDGFPLQVVRSETINGVLLIDGGHGLKKATGASPYTQNFVVPAGTITWARLYVGVWGGTESYSGSLTISFNGNTLGTAGVGQGQATGIADMVQGSGNGVWWAAVDVSDRVVANATNKASLTTQKISGNFDGRIYGAVLVAAVAQDNGPKVSYQVAEGNVCLNYLNSYDSYTLDLPVGSIAPGQVAKAGLTTVYLVGHKDAADSLTFNGTVLSEDANDASGKSLDGTSWTDNYFGLRDWDVTGLIAQNNSVRFDRGDEAYLRPVLAILTTQGTQVSSDASLSGLTISSGTLSPGFGPGTTSYTALVENSVSSITVTPTVNDSNATITVNGAAVTSGSASGPISLNVGANTISIVVTAQDGTTQQTYTVSVTRAAPVPPNCATLSSLTLSNGTLSPAFDPGILSYTTSVPYTVTSDTVTAVASSVYARVYMNGNPGESLVLPLDVGKNSVIITVYAQDGSTQTYTITVTRDAAAAGDPTLSGIVLSSGALSPAFASGVTSYTASVDNSVSTVTVTPTASDGSATITVNGTTVASGSASGPISLSVGANVISIVVTARDGVTVQTYAITVTRSSAGGSGPTPPRVTGISPNSGPYSGNTSVTITGANFTGATDVLFGSTPAKSFTVDSDTQITAVSPTLDKGGVTADVTVAGPDGVSAANSAARFTFEKPPGYAGMNPQASVLKTDLHGTGTGGLIFTKGDSQYAGGGDKINPGDTYTVNYEVTGIPDGASIKAARLYNYYCWSKVGQKGQLPQVSMILDGKSANKLNSYSDKKGMDPWDYYFGTISFDAAKIVSGNGAYTAVLTNTGSSDFCPFGTGLMIVYDDPNGQSFEYWLNEGADIIWPGCGVTEDEATTESDFPGAIDLSKVSAARLITVVTSGNKGLNTLTFNGTGWYGAYADPSQLAVDDRDVKEQLQSSGNWFSIRSEGSGEMGPHGEFSEADTLCPSNAFLVVTYAGTTSGSTGSDTITPDTGGTVRLDSEVSVEIPAGALSGTSGVNVAIRKVSVLPPVPAGFRLLGSVFEFTVGGGTEYSFAKPVTLSFTFDPASLSAGETPAIFYYDESSSRWVELGGTVSGNKISISIDHFTKFAVLAKEAAPPKEAVPLPSGPAIFSDVSASYWAASVIEKVYGLGYIKGYPDGAFRPDSSITRAEFATLLVRAYKLPVAPGKVFNDTSDHWSKDFVAAAYAAGIITGYSESSFGPDDPITREQMVMMIVKAEKIQAATAEISFKDSGEISSWAREALAAAVQHGIVKGYPDGAFRPKGKATRAEAAAIIAGVRKL